jgi:hypothetical protein
MPRSEGSGEPVRPADLARYLPLSGRPRFDESSVTGDWGPRFAQLLTAIDAMIAALPAEAMSRPDAGAARDRLSTAVAAVKPGHRVKVPALGAVLAEALDLAAFAGGHLEVDPVTSGAVALDRGLRAPLAIRAVIKHRTIRATDAGWEFGTGPELAGTAEAIIRFLYGRAGVPGS